MPPDTSEKCIVAAQIFFQGLRTLQGNALLGCQFVLAWVQRILGPQPMDYFVWLVLIYNVWERTHYVWDKRSILN